MEFIKNKWIKKIKLFFDYLIGLTFLVFFLIVLGFFIFYFLPGIAGFWNNAPQGSDTDSITIIDLGY